MKFLDEKVASVFLLLWATADSCVYSSTWASYRLQNLIWSGFLDLFRICWNLHITKLDCQGKDFTDRMCDKLLRESAFIVIKWIFWSDYFWKVWLQRKFVIQDFCLPRREKYPEKVIWMTFQTNIKLYLFPKDFSVKKKKGFLMSAMHG